MCMVSAYTITLTDKCNKGCAYCYENGVRQNITIDNVVLLKQIHRILENNLNTSKNVNFFGGEPFTALDQMKLATSFFKTYNTYNPQHQITLSFITNGILLNDVDVMSFLEQCVRDGFKPRIICSFDGIQNTISNLETNIRTLIHMFGESGVRVNYTMSKYNVQHAYENYLLAESLGVRKIHYRPVHIDFIEDPDLINVFEDQMNRLFDYLKISNKTPLELFPFINFQSAWEYTKDQVYNFLYTKKDVVGCNIGLTKHTYSIDDKTYYCHRLQFYQEYIADVYSANQYMKDNNGTFYNEQCEACETLKWCGNCSVINEIFTKDRTKPHLTLCEYYKTIRRLTHKFFKMFHPNYIER